MSDKNRRRSRGGGREARRELRSSQAQNTTNKPYIKRNIPVYDLVSNEVCELIENTADIILEEIDAAILVPEQSILTSKDFSYVFVIENDEAKLRKITKGISTDGQTQILEGLNSDDLVVTLGHEKLKDGSKIKLIDKECIFLKPL